MAIVSGVTVNFTTSPRIITIPDPLTEITVEDLQDTLLDIEDDDEGMLYDHLRNTSGGEDLGGGTSVGFTMELQDAQVAFEPRTTITSSGTATTANAAGTTLIDSAATFQADGVLPGATVHNDTDGSVATIISVDSEIQLTMYPLLEGTDNDWDSSDAYRVWNEIQCEVSGGNLVAVDSVGATLSPIFPTFGTQVLKTSSSSATTQEQIDIQYASFNGGITVNTSTGVSGTTFPTGTPRQPVDNLTDALTILNDRGFTKMFIDTSITIDSGLDFTGISFDGLSRTAVTMTVDAAANVTNCEFLNATITGTLDGGSTIERCNINTLNFVNGIVKESVIDGPITLGGASPIEAIFIDTNSGVAGTSTPIIDMGGSGPDLQVRGHSGGLRLQNKSGTNSASVEFEQGQLIIDSDVTAGTIVVRGIADVTDNSVGATIQDDTINTAISGISAGSGMSVGEFIVFKDI
jgi:hypothetical protein